MTLFCNQRTNQASFRVKILSLARAYICSIDLKKRYLLVKRTQVPQYQKWKGIAKKINICWLKKSIIQRYPETNENNLKLRLCLVGCNNALPTFNDGLDEFLGKATH